MTKAIIIAFAITFLNALSLFIIYNIALTKDWGGFNKLIFGSMVIRYAVTSGLVWFCVSYLELNVLAFALTFLISTFFLLIAEILIIHKKSLNVKK